MDMLPSIQLKAILTRLTSLDLAMLHPATNHLVAHTHTYGQIRIVLDASTPIHGRKYMFVRELYRCGY